MTFQNQYEFKARGIGEILDQAIRLYRRNFLKFIAIIALPLVPVELLQLLLNLINKYLINQRIPGVYSSNVSTISTLFLVGGGTFLTGIVSLVLVNCVAFAALTRALAGVLVGEEVKVLDAYRKIGSSWLPLLLTFLLLCLLIVGMLIWTAIPLIGWLTGIGLVAFFTFVVTEIIIPIVIIENIWGVSAIRRAWELATQRFWWLAGFFALLWLFSVLVVYGPVGILTFFLNFTSLQSTAGLGISWGTTIGESVASLLASLLFYPIQAISVALVYFDLRVRLEGLDLALQANPDIPLTIDRLRQSPQAEPRPIITWQLPGYFIAITLIVVALYAALAIPFFILMTRMTNGGF